MFILLYRSETFSDEKQRLSEFDGYETKYWLEVGSGQSVEVDFSLMHDIANIDSNAPRKHYEAWPDKRTNEYRVGQKIAASNGISSEAMLRAFLSQGLLNKN